jgi:ADP-ribose pyrophosphatase YjhB (NUDIX family)
MLLGMDLSTHGIVALVRNAEGKFLLLKDAREQMKDHWAPPHGRCESTDKSEEAGVIREVYEETKLAVTPVRNILTQPADTKVKTVSFWVVDCQADQLVVLDEESSAYGWYSVDEALDLLLYPGTKLLFEKLKSGQMNL